MEKIATSYHSQNNEDEIIQSILNFTAVKTGTFVEFGAWDGVYLSNTCHLAELGWSGLFIEADKTRFEDLKRNHAGRDIELINAFVSPQGENTLGNIIRRSSLKGAAPTVLSIDIDSDDLAVWKGCDLRPLIVVIEYNPTIPGDVSFTNPPGEACGNSALAIYDHARSINYALVAQTACNLIFVDGERLPEGLKPIDFLDAQRTSGIRFFFAYDGRMFKRTGADIRFHEIMLAPWSNTPFAQPIPRWMRGFRESRGSRVRSMIFGTIYLAVTRPLSTVGFIGKNFGRVAAKLWR